MGIVIGRFRKTKSTYEILEKLESDIVSIEEFGRSTELSRKRIIGRFILFAIIIYLILALLIYFYYQRITDTHKVLCVVPLIAFPFLIIIIKKILAWYYSRKIKRNEKKLVKLKDEKKKIIDNVMETETYKVAKKILDKFGNGSDTSKTPGITVSDVTATSLQTALVSRNGNQTELRQRTVGPRAPPGSQLLISSTLPKARLSFGTPRSSLPRPQPESQLVSARTAIRSPIVSTPLALPGSIPPKDRSVLDKMIDFLLGDGPSNRYALICQKCSGHNGMVLKEKFEYFSFRCIYCSYLNPAMKQRFSPKLELGSPSQKTITSGRTSESDNSIESEEEKDEEESKHIIEEVRSDSPDTEKYSDFDKLSDLDLKETEAEKVEGDEASLQESLMDVDDDNVKSNISGSIENITSQKEPVNKDEIIEKDEK